MTHLVDLQAEITAERAARGFTTDPLRILTLLTEDADACRTWHGAP